MNKMQIKARLGVAALSLMVGMAQAANTNSIVAIRDPNSPTLQKPRPAIPLVIPDEYADSHDRMIHIAKSYYDAPDNNNGHLAPFAPGLNGLQDCTSQIDSGTFQYITTIEDRRVEVADTVTGLAIGVSLPYNSPTGWE